ncbi:hypothetical protein Goari_017987 [Gossypium aridum]|uniref:SCP2 domain-containing protein n=1 Tax=Gossypium aridum TaxID=34290 RepID=A0A7J8WNM4_GOSAI|nr:hypothetical protein [Gossypium aridum]
MATTELKSDNLFEMMKIHLASDAGKELIKNIGLVYQINIAPKDDDFIKVATGKMNPQIAFMRGAMKIKGSLSAAQKFTPDVFPKPTKM